MTLCIHGKGFPNNRGGLFIYDQFLIYCLISQGKCTAYGIVLIG